MRVPPRLEHLRRDARRRPVPYINRWGTNADTRLALRDDRHVGGLAVFMDDDADGLVPDFTEQNMQRQRECTMAGLCQVCARPIPWSRRFLVLGGMSIQTIDLAGEQRHVVTEPWLDEECARFAMDVCPALIRRRRDEALTLLPITSSRDVEVAVSKGWIEGPLEAESRRRMPVMWAKLILLNVDLVDAATAELAR